MTEQGVPNLKNIDKLFEKAMQGDWDTVVHAYTDLSRNIIENYNARSAKRETALHVAVAVANDETEHVSEIIEGIPKSNLQEILRMRNRRGNTPLHLAAATGKVYICWSLASKDKSLVAEKNEEGETPLFLAAHRGHEKAFFYLEYLYGKEDISKDMLIKSSGDTVLHSAIYGENYGFAVQILESYPNLVNCENNESLTPLHVLALQPHSFKSSTTHLGLFDLIFYKCLIIERHVWEDRKDDKDIVEIQHNRYSRRYPSNCKTCCNLFDMLKQVFVYIGHGRSNASDRTDINEANLEGGKGRLIKEEAKENRPSTTVCNVVFQILKFIVFVPFHFLVSGGKGRLIKEEAKENRPSTTICNVVFQILKLIVFVPFHFLVSERLLTVADLKRKHKWAERLMFEMLDKAYTYKTAKKFSEVDTASPSSTSTITCNKNTQGTTMMTILGKKEEKKHRHPQCQPNIEEKQSSEPCIRGETPLLTAARLGIYEMVDGILKRFPEAIEDEDYKSKNAVLLAAENRQSSVYRLLQNKEMVHESVFSQVDVDGNSVLHLASRYNPDRPWFTPGPAMQMKWEITWHQYIKNSMPSNLFALRNNVRKTSIEIFNESHEDLRKEGQAWLTGTCTAYSVIATLIATVAFATSSTIPGDYNSGTPALEPEFAFSVFSISSLVALCTSMSATVFFIAILTARFEQEDFAVKLPRRLQLGLTFLFLSIASMLVSFTSGFYFNVRNKLENAAYPIFAVICLPVILFAIAQLPLYLDLTHVIFLKSES